MTFARQFAVAAALGILPFAVHAAPPPAELAQSSTQPALSVKPHSQPPVAYHAPPLAAAPVWPKVYAAVSAVLGFHTWGRILGWEIFGPPQTTSSSAP